MSARRSQRSEAGRCASLSRCLSLSLLFSLLLLALSSLPSFSLASHSSLPSPPSFSLSSVPSRMFPGSFLSLPPSRCFHSFTRLSASLATHLAKGTYTFTEGRTVIEGDSAGQLLEESGAFMMFGGVGANGETLSDGWLLQARATPYNHSAHWIPLTTFQIPVPSKIAARAAYSLEYLPSTGELLVFGGQNADGLATGSVFRFNPAASEWEEMQPDDTVIRARSQQRAWVRLGSPPGSISEPMPPEEVLLFGGKGADGKLLNDLWRFNTSTNEWSQPESLTCSATGEYCPDARSFHQLFPELDLLIQPLLSNATRSVSPKETLATLTSMKDLNAQLTTLLTSPPISTYPYGTNGTCFTECTADNSGALPDRPSARAGHQVSLWTNFTHPLTDEPTNKVLLWGGHTCEGEQGGEACYDVDLYILDLDTWEWSVHRKPTTPSTATPWPHPRAHHVQHLYVTNDTAQLWIMGGRYVDEEGSVLLPNDVAVFDLVEERWFISSLDEQHQHKLHTAGYNPDAHPLAIGAASFLLGDQLWMHGGCTEVDGVLEPIPTIHPSDTNAATLQLLRLNPTLSASNVRVTNDAPEWLYGQGITEAQPGRDNYFFMQLAQNWGYTLPQIQRTNETNSTDPTAVNILEELNSHIIGLPPSNVTSTPLPYWGYDLPWSTELTSRFEVQLISHFLPGGDETSMEGVVAEAGDLVFQQASIQQLEGGRYRVEYRVNGGSQFIMYVRFDGVEVPGSPFKLRMEAGEASGANTIPIDASSRPIPPLEYDEKGQIKAQHFGNMDIPRPLAGGGQGLVRAIRGRSASFLLQVVDVYGNAWLDDSNTVRYLNDSISSAVPFQAVNLSMSIRIPDVPSQPLQELSFSSFNYVINSDGTVSVHYFVPDVTEFGVRVVINEDPIAKGRVFKVKGISPLELNDVQSIGMLTISTLVSAVMIVSFGFFVVKRRTQQVQSISLLLELLLTIGCICGTFAILEQTQYSGGVRTGWDYGYYLGNHNACQLYNVLLSLAILLCFGSLYAMVRRNVHIRNAIRLSVHSKKFHVTLNSDFHTHWSGRSDAPIPLIRHRPSDWRIVLPVFGLLFIELLFQLIWVFVAPLEPGIQVARDDFRTYKVCDGPDKEAWVYTSIAIKALMCFYFLLHISRGRSAADALNENKRTVWVSWNMALTLIIVTLLAFFVDSYDSIKTSFMATSFGVVWSCFLYVILVTIPRVHVVYRASHNNAQPNPFWYDHFIQRMQEAALAAKRAEKEEREARIADLPMQPSGSGSGSGSGVVTSSSPPTGSLRALRQQKTAALPAHRSPVHRSSRPLPQPRVSTTAALTVGSLRKAPPPPLVLAIARSSVSTTSPPSQVQSAPDFSDSAAATNNKEEATTAAVNPASTTPAPNTPAQTAEEDNQPSSNEHDKAAVAPAAAEEQTKEQTKEQKAQEEDKAEEDKPAEGEASKPKGDDN